MFLKVALEKIRVTRLSDSGANASLREWRLSEDHATSFSMRIFSALYAAMVFLSVTSCAHKDLAKNSPPMGQTKSEIVETFGSPERSWRSDGKDHWFYSNSSKILTFEKGVLISIRSPESPVELEDLENELRKLKDSKAEKFETLSD